MPSDTEPPPIVIFDTSALKPLGESIDKPNLHRLLHCSVNGYLQLYMPHEVLSERASQEVEKKLKIERRRHSQENQNLEKIHEINGSLPIEQRRLYLMFEKNGASILATEPRHRRKANSLIEKNTYDCSEMEDKDRRDAIIAEVAIELATKEKGKRLIFAVNDKFPRKIINDSDVNITLYDNNEILHKLLAHLPEDGSKNVSSVSDDELSPLDIQTVVDTAQERPPSLANFNMEEAQREMAERFKFSQQCLIAASHLMFPETDKEGVAEKLKQAWDIEPTETEGAANYLMKAGHLEDLYGDYSVTNEDFAEQAIYALGNDINNLIKVLD
jgi:hypothetical protein